MPPVPLGASVTKSGITVTYDDNTTQEISYANKTFSLNRGLRVKAGSSYLAGKLDVIGDSHFHNSLIVDKDTHISGKLDVSDAAHIRECLTVDGGFTLNGTLDVLDNTILGRNLNVAGVSEFVGDSKFKKNVVVDGNFTVLGRTTTINTINMAIKDNAILIADNNQADLIQSGIMIQYKPDGSDINKYAGIKRLPVSGEKGGEFIFYKDATNQIAPNAAGGNIGIIDTAGDVARILHAKQTAEAELPNLFAAKEAAIAAIDNVSCCVPDDPNAYAEAVAAAHNAALTATSAWQAKSNLILELSAAYNNAVIADNAYKVLLAAEQASAEEVLRLSKLKDITDSAIIPLENARDAALKLVIDTLLLKNEAESAGSSATNEITAWEEAVAAKNAAEIALATAVAANIEAATNLDAAITTHRANQLAITPTPTAAASNGVYAVVMAKSFNCASDARLKNNIITLDGALDKLDSIRGVYHQWNNEVEPHRAIGVIAQEVQAVYPELVTESSNGFLSVDYPKLTVVLLQSIKELKAMVLELAKK